MKKYMTLIAMFAIAGVVRAAGLMNGDFSTGSGVVTYLNRAGGIGNQDAHYDRGEYSDSIKWLQAHNKATYWTIQTSGGQGDSGGYVQVKNGNHGALTQTWTDDKATTGSGWELSFYYKVTNMKNNGSVTVGLLGLNHPWHTKAWGDMLSLSFDSIESVYPLEAEGGKGLGVILGQTSFDVSADIGWTKVTISDLNLGAGYEHLSFVVTGNGEGSDVGIDTIQFSLTPPPSEPATPSVIE